MNVNLRNFEKFSLIAFLVGTLNTFFNFEFIDKSTINILVIQALFLFPTLALILLISRRQSKIAKWIYTAIFIGELTVTTLSLNEIIADMTTGQIFNSGARTILVVIQVLLQGVGIYFLYFGEKTTDEISK
jgi:hypothetical protein